MAHKKFLDIFPPSLVLNIVAYIVLGILAFGRIQTDNAIQTTRLDQIDKRLERVENKVDQLTTHFTERHNK